jgi:hypothetical protein
MAGFCELVIGLRAPKLAVAGAKSPIVSGGYLKYSRFRETATGDRVRSGLRDGQFPAGCRNSAARVSKQNGLSAGHLRPLETSRIHCVAARQSVKLITWADLGTKSCAPRSLRWQTGGRYQDHSSPEPVWLAVLKGAPSPDGSAGSCFGLGPADLAMPVRHLLIRAARDVPQRIVRQRPSQRLCLIPWRAHRLQRHEPLRDASLRGSSRAATGPVSRAQVTALKSLVRCLSS